MKDAVRENAFKFCKELTKDRDKALTFTKPCPCCSTKQVQLVDYSPYSSGWKCRHCKYGWRIIYETL